MKNKLIIALLLCVLSFGLVQAQNVIYEGVDPSGQSVVYWHQYSDDSSQANTMSALIEEFNGSNEYGITVETIHQGSYGPIQDLMNTAILSGELPNLVAAYANAAAGWANEGVVVDINLLLNSPEWGIAAAEQAHAELQPARCQPTGLSAFPRYARGLGESEFAESLLY